MEHRVISFHYSVADASGQTVDSSAGREPLTYMEGAGQIVPGLENALAKLAVGDKRTITVAPADAYGDRSEDLVVKVAPSKLPSPNISIGDRFRGGQEHDSPVFTVTQVTPEEITLDGNHPLAGQTLTFDVEITGAREATAEEIQHGHAHGPHGHSH